MLLLESCDDPSPFQILRFFLMYYVNSNFCGGQWDHFPESFFCLGFNNIENLALFNFCINDKIDFSTNLERLRLSCCWNGILCSGWLRYYIEMSRIAKWKLEKTKVKVVFRLQFHATHVSQLISLADTTRIYFSFLPMFFLGVSFGNMVPMCSFLILFTCHNEDQTYFSYRKNI